MKKLWVNYLSILFVAFSLNNINCMTEAAEGAGGGETTSTDSTPPTTPNPDSDAETVIATNSTTDSWRATVEPDGSKMTVHVPADTLVINNLSGYKLIFQVTARDDQRQEKTFEQVVRVGCKQELFAKRSRITKLEYRYYPKSKLRRAVTPCPAYPIELEKIENCTRQNPTQACLLSIGSEEDVITFEKAPLPDSAKSGLKTAKDAAYAAALVPLAVKTGAVGAGAVEVARRCLLQFKSSFSPLTPEESALFFTYTLPTNFSAVFCGVKGSLTKISEDPNTAVYLLGLKKKFSKSGQTLKSDSLDTAHEYLMSKWGEISESVKANATASKFAEDVMALIASSYVATKTEMAKNK